MRSKCDIASDNIVFLEPVCTHNIWGGTKLREEFGCKEEGNDIGECWGISAHPKGDCIIANGPYEGERLSWLWEKHRELFGVDAMKSGAESIFPLLVKILDAKEDLSIQVHPDDSYAFLHENGQLGKTECWYVLDCPEDAKLVVGHNAKSREDLSKLIDSGKWNDLIREVPVKKGDLIQIDPGTVHAIKAGFVILETQQSSDVTYRVYDYDRLQDGKPRELHLSQSKDVINAPADSIESSIVEGISDEPENTLNMLYNCDYYKIFHMKVNEEANIEQNYDFLNVTVTDGAGEIDGVKIKKGSNFILPYGFGTANLSGHMELIASTV